MRTRRSPRNQQILYKAIGHQLAIVAAINNVGAEDPDPQPGITFPSAVPKGTLPVFSVGDEEEARALIVAACPTNTAGQYIARELAEEQTLGEPVCIRRSSRQTTR